MSTTPNPEPSHDEPPDLEDQPGVDPDWPQVPGPKPHPGPDR